MKKPSRTPLQKEIEKLLRKYEETEILCNLISEVENKPEISDIGRLNEEMILHLTIVEKMNVVKPETVLQQMQIEESMRNIFPHYAEQQTSLHLQY